jgi:lantibiotic modifying enzyme
MSWCHGPAGTARLFYRLGQITHESPWTEWVHGAAGALMASGIPDRLTPGFWNNVSCCCGCMGVSQFFIDMHRTYGDRKYLAYARHVADNALGRATTDGRTEKWIQAEHRVKPELLIAQTGFMQGASGIGTYLLHLDALERGTRPRITFPDSPFVV